MPTTCLRVGVTGGIGSGKSLVCRIFAALGVPVYDADYWAKWLIVNDPAVKSGILDLLGSEAYMPDGSYNRAFVAGVVFADPDKLAALNALVHPAVEQHSKRWHEQQALAGAAYTIKEAALMIESGSHRFLDKLIVVTAPEDIRIQRVMQRDGVGEQAVLSRMRQQLPEAEKLRLADYIIENDGKHPLLPRIWQIHRELTGRNTSV